jgi:hypothetical protein
MQIEKLIYLFSIQYYSGFDNYFYDTESGNYVYIEEIGFGEFNILLHENNQDFMYSHSYGKTDSRYDKISRLLQKRILVDLYNNDDIIEMLDIYKTKKILEKLG